MEKVLVPKILRTRSRFPLSSSFAIKKLITLIEMISDKKGDHAKPDGVPP